MFFEFLWNNKPPKIKKDCIIGPIENGGLGMVDVFSTHLTAKVKVIKRLLYAEDAKWKVLAWELLNIQKDTLSKRCCPTANKISSNFYNQVLYCWYSIKPKNTKLNDISEILNEYIYCNNYITANGNCIYPPSNACSKLINIKIIDIIEPTGRLLEYNQFKDLFKIKVMMYNSVISAIPKDWKSLLLSKVPYLNLKKMRLNDEPQVKIKHCFKTLATISNKQIYNELIVRKCKPPTSLQTWIEAYPFLETANWDNIFELPFKIIKEPYLQSFQFKIIHRILNCNDKLCTWKILPTSECQYCGNIDTIEHHLVLCPKSTKFWNQVTEWLYENLKIKINLTECEILFGIPFHKDNKLKIINFVVLLGKWFINKTRTADIPIYFINFLTTLRDKVETMCNINPMNTTSDKWYKDILDIL